MTGDLTAVVHDAAEVVVGPGDAATDGDGDPGDVLDRREDAAVAVVDGEVAAVGPTADVTREYPPENAAYAVDAGGRSVVPGFVDPHTHAAFAGDRSDEFARKLRGESYQDVLESGGGILRTVRAVREAGDATLRANLREHLDAMLAAGTTTVEVKSGYGLDTETELRLLDAIDRVGDEHPVDVVPTFMGAHAVPEGETTAGYVDRVVDEQLPAVADQGVAAFCDVFCEDGVFDVRDSRRVLAAGREHGLTPKVHAEEFSHLGGAQLAAEVGAASADHLLQATPEDAAALADAGVTPVFLPGTAFGLGGEYADPAPFREAGAPPALATDFNPNCYARTMGFAQTLACVGMEFSPAEALLGATHRAAAALDLPPAAGTLQPGAPGDLVVLDAPSYVHVPYRFDSTPVSTVLAEGVVVRD